jgi:hypothetical protein
MAEAIIMARVVRTFQHAFDAGWDYHAACATDESNKCWGCQTQLDNLTSAHRNTVRTVIALWPHIDVDPDQQLGCLKDSFKQPKEVMFPQVGHTCGDGVHLSIVEAQAIIMQRIRVNAARLAEWTRAQQAMDL